MYINKASNIKNNTVISKTDKEKYVTKKGKSVLNYSSSNFRILACSLDSPLTPMKMTLSRRVW